jgi:hypothetical protein
MAHRTEVSFKGDFYDRITANVKKLPKEFSAEFMRKSRNPIRNLRRRVRRTPSRFPTHPFIWSFDAAAQARARRWWFAAIAGRIPGVKIQTSGGRYKRTGRGPKSIMVIFDRKDGIIAIEVPASGFGLYTVGPKQVPSHARTPWPNIEKEAEKAEVQFLDNAIKVWIDVSDKVIP